MKRYFHIFILILIFSFGSSTLAQAQGNVGFVENSIWYSQTPKVEGESVKVYTAIWNGSASDISAHVEFYDGTTLLGSRDVKVTPENISDVFIIWKVTAGDHNISARITKSSTLVGGVATNFTVADNNVAANKISISKKVAVDVGAITPVDTIAKKVSDALPAQVAAPVKDIASQVDNYREDTRVTIEENIIATKKKIAEMDKPVSKSSTTSKDKNPKLAANSLSGTDKPIAYVELFFLTCASFIFTNKVVFYGICIVLLFLVLRFIFNKIKR